MPSKDMGGTRRRRAKHSFRTLGRERTASFGSSGRRPVALYALIVLAVMMAAVAAVQFVPGGMEESSADAFTINLGGSTNVTGATWSGNTLTFSTAANSHIYTFTGTRAILSVVFPTGVTTTVIMNGVTASSNGTITLNGTANITLLLEGTNSIKGHIVVASTASITIDSTTPGSSRGSLTVTPFSENIAGIGGKNEDGLTTTPGNTGKITINGGTVTATGGKFAAGIGGGTYGNGTIIINGGKVTATGGSEGAGIGSGYNVAGGSITINGGDVTATGGGRGAGIGGGYGGAGGNVTISGGTVNASGSAGGGAGIGGGVGIGGADTAGATLTIGSNAEVKAYSAGSLPAIHVSSVAGASTGYYVNACFSNAISSTQTTTMAVFKKEDPSASVGALELPPDNK